MCSWSLSLDCENIARTSASFGSLSEQHDWTILGFHYSHWWSLRWCSLIHPLRVWREVWHECHQLKTADAFEREMLLMGRFAMSLSAFPNAFLLTLYRPSSHEHVICDVFHLNRCCGVISDCRGAKKVQLERSCSLIHGNLLFLKIKKRNDPRAIVRNRAKHPLAIEQLAAVSAADSALWPVAMIAEEWCEFSARKSGFRLKNLKTS